MQAFEIIRRTIIAEVNLEMLCELHTKVGACARAAEVPGRDPRHRAGHGGRAQPSAVCWTSSARRVARCLKKTEMFDIYRGAQLLSGKEVCRLLPDV